MTFALTMLGDRFSAMSLRTRAGRALPQAGARLGHSATITIAGVA